MDETESDFRLSKTAILGVDWGSSSVRVMRIAADGRILAVRRAADGVFSASGGFDERLRGHLGDWLVQEKSAPIILCGMIGSDRGWLTAPYVPAPAGLEQIARALAAPAFLTTARIVPGVSFAAAHEAEVMRGEETLAMGFVAQCGLRDAIICLPGTHSKWVRLRAGRIARFRTYMTGELRVRLLAEGALATDAEQVACGEAFLRGLNTKGALSRRLFQARARWLLGGLKSEHTASFVSGVLIGEEVAAEAMNLDQGIPVFVAARGALAGDYRAALDHARIAHTLVDPEPLAALGLLTIARHAGLAGDA